MCIRDRRKTGLRSAAVLEFGAIEAGVAMALSNLNYSNIHARSGSILESESKYLNANNNQSMLDAGINFKVKAHGVKLKLEMGKNYTSNRRFKKNDNYVALGLVLEIDDLINKIKAQ